ncbi:uncharacterized protein LOC121878152 isoform X2 [Homarus americanus]|nr:uncharacterized protein LOC121878152 isoform X2 [Homarus americanus]
MKFLVGLVLCLPTVLGRPADKTKTTEVTSTNPNDERFPRSPPQFSSSIQVTGSSNRFSFFDNQNEIPNETRDQFTPPDPPSKNDREQKYFSNFIIEMPPHAHIVVHDEPFFDSLDHGKIILALEQRRKRYHLPLHKLKSLRPYFPFFVLD